MGESIEGQTIKVTTKGSDDGAPVVTFYAIAEPDLVKAEEIIREAMGPMAGELIEAVGPLTAAEVAALGLKPGKFERL